MSKKSKQDPHAQREAQKYENPVASREFILEHLKSKPKPLSFKQLLMDLAIETEGEKIGLRRRLRAMVRDGQLITTFGGAYAIVEKMDLIPGTVLGHRDGFGFLRADDREKYSEDFFLPSREMARLFPGDHILVRLTGFDVRGRKEVQLVEVLAHRTTRVVGTLRHEGGADFVVPEDKRITQDIWIPTSQCSKAKLGQVVVAKIIHQPTLRTPAQGEIIEVLGEPKAPGMEIDVALRNYDLPHKWSRGVIAEAKAFGSKIAEQEKKVREDIRSLPLVTIDGEDAKDFDDAVYCEKRSGGRWKLFVAIADVSYYVKPRSKLDLDAKERGNSVYFPENVIPMLPENLSNGLCSLKPKVDRLCMVCEMNISADAKLTRTEFYPAVMRSHARLTYTEVAALLGGENVAGIREDLIPHLEALHELYKVLQQGREQRGTIEFDTLESRIIFDEQRKIADIVSVERNDAHKLIEACMLMANVAAAKYLTRHRMQTLFRNHGTPNADKVKALKEFLASIGVRHRIPAIPLPEHFAAVIEHTLNRPDATLIQTMVLRSMMQAEYAVENEGHFGLAYDCYTHFTSPIRRYPDLLVHRAIKHILAGEKPKAFYADAAMLQEVATHCSMTERRADDATRDVVSWLKCEFMQGKLGEEFTGIISTVTQFGFFVELDDIFVSGLVHVNTLRDDYYHFCAKSQTLEAEHAHRKFSPGDKVEVKLVRVGLEDKQIDFILTEDIALEKPKQKVAKRKSPTKKRKAKSGKARR